MAIISNKKKLNIKLIIIFKMNNLTFYHTKNKLTTCEKKNIGSLLNINFWGNKNLGAWNANNNGGKAMKNTFSKQKCEFYITMKYLKHKWLQKTQTLGTTNLNEHTSSTKKAKKKKQVGKKETTLTSVWHWMTVAESGSAKEPEFNDREWLSSKTQVWRQRQTMGAMFDVGFDDNGGKREKKEQEWWKNDIRSGGRGDNASYNCNTLERYIKTIISLFSCDCKDMLRLVIFCLCR